MQTFDWPTCQRLRAPQIYEFYKNNWNRPITEAEYVSFIAAVPREGKRHPSKTRSPSHARNEYHYLKTKFGFFQP